MRAVGGWPQLSSAVAIPERWVRQPVSSPVTATEPMVRIVASRAARRASTLCSVIGRFVPTGRVASFELPGEVIVLCSFDRVGGSRPEDRRVGTVDAVDPPPRVDVIDEPRQTGPVGVGSEVAGAGEALEVLTKPARPGWPDAIGCCGLVELPLGDVGGQGDEPTGEVVPAGLLTRVVGPLSEDSFQRA